MIAQVVVNPITIRSWPRRPIVVNDSYKDVQPHHYSCRRIRGYFNFILAMLSGWPAFQIYSLFTYIINQASPDKNGSWSNSCFSVDTVHLTWIITYGWEIPDVSLNDKNCWKQMWITFNFFLLTSLALPYSFNGLYTRVMGTLFI